MLIKVVINWACVAGVVVSWPQLSTWTFLRMYLHFTIYYLIMLQTTNSSTLLKIKTAYADLNLVRRQKGKGKKEAWIAYDAAYRLGYFIALLASNAFHANNAGVILILKVMLD